MTYRQHIRALLVLGLPLVGSHLAQFAVGVVDTIMLGWYGVQPLAASVLATSLFFVLFIMGSGFAFAVMPMVAQAAASEDQVRIRRVTRMGIWLSIIYGVLVLPAMIWSAPVLTAFGQEPALAELSQGYLRIAALGMFPALLVMVLKSYLAALERTQIVLWVTLGAVVLNAGLNWLLIFGNFGFPELGVRGAAVASVCVHSGSLVAMIVYIRLEKELRNHELFLRIWRPDPPAFVEVFRLGWPIGLTNLAEVGMFAAAALIIGKLGTLPLAAHGIALQVGAAMFMVHLGLSQAVTVRAGRALGRGDLPGLWRGGLVGMAMSMLVVAATLVVLLGAPELLISGFLSPDDPNRLAIIAICTPLLAVAALFQLVDAGQVMALGLLRAMHDTRVPMVVAGFSYWGLGIPASYLLALPLGYGAVGAWMGLVIGLAMACILLGIRFLRLFGRMSTAAGPKPDADRS